MYIGSFHIGARILKTGLAVFLCLLVNVLIPASFGVTGLHGCIAAAICMMPSAKGTLNVGANRTIATVLSFAAGLGILSLYSLVPGWYTLARLLLIPVFIILLILVCNLINRHGSALLACAIFLILALAPAMSLYDALVYCTLRLIDTAIGIFIAWTVNRFIHPSEKYHPELFTPDDGPNPAGPAHENPGAAPPDARLHK